MMTMKKNQTTLIPHFALQTLKIIPYMAQTHTTHVCEHVRVSLSTYFNCSESLHEVIQPDKHQEGWESQGFTSFWFLWYWLRLALLSSYVLLKCVSPSIAICTRDRLSSTSPFRTSSGIRKLRAWQSSLISKAFPHGAPMNQIDLKVCSCFWFKLWYNCSISVVNLNKCERCHLNFDPAFRLIYKRITD